VNVVVEAQRVQVTFRHGQRHLQAVDGVDLQLTHGQTLGLVGESGSGKSTLARALLGMVPVSGGHVLLNGIDVTNPRGGRLDRVRRAVSIVFQDPNSSLNPRMQVGDAIEEVVAARAQSGERAHRERSREILAMVGLDSRLARRYPHQLSGGQRQRVALARALAGRPEVLILDEVTSALDVLVQANILNLLRRLQTELKLSYLFISHNLSVVRHMSDEIAVMYLGRILEYGPVDEVLGGSRHPYTRALVEAVPAVGRRPVPKVLGDAPNPYQPPRGCRYHTRCAVGPVVNPDRSICVERDPSFNLDGSLAPIACHFAGL
jgi:peptide/nickel transport system ATP-binding protein